MENLLKDIPNSELSLLMGSGVCTPHPTSLPDAGSLTTTLVEALTTDTSFRRNLIERRSLRFESVMQAVADHIDPGLQILSLFGDGPTPNPYHYAACGLAGDGAAILTTNFDTLFERAADKLGTALTSVSEDADYELALTTSTASNVLCKLHGSLQATEGQSKPDAALGATIRGVGTQGFGFRRRPALRSLLQKLLQGRALVVLGYSGLDFYDVVPLVVESTPQHVLWFHYYPGVAPTTSLIDDQTPHGNLLRTLRNNGSSCEILTGDPAMYLSQRDCWSSGPSGSPAELGHSSTDLSQYVNDWVSDRCPTQSSRNLLLALIAGHAREVETAYDLLELVIDSCEADPLDRAKALQGAAVLAPLTKHANSGLAIQRIAEAKDIYDKFHMSERSNAAQGCLGTMLLELGRQDLALRALESSLAGPLDDDDRAAALHNTGNILMARGAMDEARIRLDTSLRITRKLGQLGGTSQTASLLGKALALKEDPEAAKYLTEAVHADVMANGFRCAHLWDLAIHMSLVNPKLAAAYFVDIMAGALALHEWRYAIQGLVMAATMLDRSRWPSERARSIALALIKDVANKSGIDSESLAKQVSNNDPALSQHVDPLFRDDSLVGYMHMAARLMAQQSGEDQ